MRNKSVFIVEDDPDLLEFYSMILEVNNWIIKGMTSNGFKAVDLYKNMNSRPDIVILDLILPGSSGIDIAKAILDIDPSQKILFISGHTALLDDDPQLCQLPRLRKAFSVTQLLSKLEELNGFNNHLETNGESMKNMGS